jgi:hypothetical protein
METPQPMPTQSQEPQITKPSTPTPAPAPALSQNPPSPDSKKDKEDEEDKVVKVANGWKTKKEGFIYVSVKGNATERGLAHGELLADRIIKFIRTYAYYIYDSTGYTIHLFIEMMADLFMSKNTLDDKYKEIVEELKGIAAGVVKAIQGGKITDETKKNIISSSSSTEPPRILLTSDSFYSPEGSDSTPPPEKSSVAIDEKAIFLLNGIFSLFYIFPHLEKLLNEPEYSEIKKKPIYAEFLSDASYKFVAAAAASKDSSKDSSTPTPTPTPPSATKSSLIAEISKFFGSGSDKCSAFMAVGPSHTKDGQIVCAHITFDDFISGQFNNIILNLQTSDPTNPSTTSADMLMQTFPGGIFSGLDFFNTSFGFIGMETTLGGFDSFELKAPICFRARKAMQYGKTLEDYVAYLSEHNSGDYACTWYIGKVKKTESDPPDKIMRIELGRRFVNVKKTEDGYFIGFNAAYDPRIRNIECQHDGFYDSRRHQGARRIRLEEIMQECIKRGIKIDEDVAIKIISDHKDVYLDKPNNPCSRTICAHYDEDKREYMSDPSRPKPDQPRGALDAKVGSSKLFRKNRFLAIWGRACGAPFIAKEFCEKHLLWANQKEYLEDRPTRSWVECNCILADRDTEAANALTIYKKSVYETGDSDIFSSSSSPTPTPSPASAASATTAPSAPSATIPVAPTQAQVPSSRLDPEANTNSLIKPLQQPQPQPQPQQTKQNPVSDVEFHDFGGGKYTKKDMKTFMKMLKSKNKKSTKQVTKNRNTKKNKQ